jgi:hypothetical protein
MDFFYSISDFFNEFSKTYEFETSLIVFKFLFIIIMLAFIVFGIWFRIKAGFYKELKMKYGFYLKKIKTEPVAELPAKELENYWNQLIGRLNVNDDAQWKLAIIEADNLFDHVLTLLGYEGESLGEKLKKVNQGSLKCIDDVWRAHKTRNMLVHETSFQLSYREAEKTVGIYEKALKEFGILK